MERGVSYPQQSTAGVKWMCVCVCVCVWNYVGGSAGRMDGPLAFPIIITTGPFVITYTDSSSYFYHYIYYISFPSSSPSSSSSSSFMYLFHYYIFFPILFEIFFLFTFFHSSLLLLIRNINFFSFISLFYLFIFFLFELGVNNRKQLMCWTFQEVFPMNKEFFFPKFRFTISKFSSGSLLLPTPSPSPHLILCNK